MGGMAKSVCIGPPCFVISFSLFCDAYVYVYDSFFNLFPRLCCPSCGRAMQRFLTLHMVREESPRCNAHRTRTLRCNAHRTRTLVSADGFDM